MSVQIWLYEAVPELFESGSAVKVTVFQLALAAGTYIGGVIVDQSGILVTFYVGGALGVLCSVLILFANRNRLMAPAYTPPRECSNRIFWQCIVCYLIALQQWPCSISKKGMK